MTKIYKVELNKSGAPNFATAEEVVRCRDCKHWQSDGGAMMVCEHVDIPTDACDFCSWAEREGE